MFSNIPIPSLSELSSYKSYAKCVLNVAKSSLNGTKAISFILPHKHINKTDLASEVLITSLLETNNWAISIKNISYPEYKIRKKAFKVKFYIIYIQDLQELGLILHEMQNFLYWNPAARFLIISKKTVKRPPAEVHKIFKQLLKASVINAVVLLPKPTNPETFDLFTWFPFWRNNCANDTTPIYINTCSKGFFTRTPRFFINKVPKKFNKCPVKVRAVAIPPFVMNVKNGTWRDSLNMHQFEGIETSILNTIAEELNLKIFYYFSDMPSNWGTMYANLSVTPNSDLDVLRRNGDNAHIAIGAHQLTYEKSLLFNYLPYLQQTLHWCVPNVVEDRKMENIQEIVPASIAYSIFVVFAASAVIVRLLVSHQDRQWAQNFGTCLLNAYAIFMGTSTRGLARSNQLRIYLTALFFFSFYFISGYQTLMTSILLKTDTYQKIETFEDILTNNLKIVKMDRGVRYFDKNSPEYEEVEKRYSRCRSDLSHCIRLVTRDHAIILSRISLEYRLAEYVDNITNAPLIHCFPNQLRWYSISLIVKKGFPFFDHFARIIERLINMGFVDKWLKAISAISRQRSSRTGSLERKAFTFEDLKVFFHLWVSGCVLASIAFISELLFNKIRKILSSSTEPFSL